MGGENTEGYADPTAAEAIGRVTREEKQRYKDMCYRCKHCPHCGTAFKKDVWCGNHKARGGNFV